ncbi:hypothetical protein ACVVIH_16060 [Chryseobacterium arthrosphaerae]|uniref:hypothetical protein n=1 Tax=Chryseobacterium arthrosphaerae TaxID=651561 RepID=UPI001BAFE491|nr:hypothetical protein [Chryseobacterium arthrosphaerae]QUY55243.1 hypothetical protein I2F65_20650 [Chryseobacterium arthrosphaerae]
MKKIQNIVLFLSVILFIGLVYISLFNVYQTDDYMASYGTREFGLLGNFINTYMTWGGRYFGYTVNMLNPVSYDSSGIFPKVYPVFLMVSFIGVSALNFKACFRNSSKESLKKGFILFFFYTLLLISIPEHYYWVTGSNIYFMPVILSGLLLYSVKKNEDTGKTIWLFLSLLLIVLLMGSNEILALILQGVLMVFCYRNRSKQNLIFLLVGTFFLLVSFLAPGNFNRMGEAESGLAKWLKRMALFGVNTLYVTFKTILVIPLFISVFEKELKSIAEKIPFKKAVLIWAVSLIPLLFTGYILNSIARQFESILFYFLITFSLVVILKLEKIKQFWWASLLIVFLPEMKIFPERYAYFNIDFNMANIAAEVFSTDLKEYEREVDERINIIKNSSGDSVVVDQIKTVPRVLYFSEMASEKEEPSFVNDQLQKYFKKKYIRTK